MLSEHTTLRIFQILLSILPPNQGLPLAYRITAITLMLTTTILVARDSDGALNNITVDPGAEVEAEAEAEVMKEIFAVEIATVEMQ